MPPGHPPKTSQNRPKSPPRRNFFALKFRPRFGIDFGPILALQMPPFGHPFGDQNRSKIDQKNDQKFYCSKCRLKIATRPPKTLPGPPQERPQTPQDHPKTTQELPKRPPRPPQMPPRVSRRPQDAQKCSQEAPKTAPRHQKMIPRGPTYSQERLKTAPQAPGTGIARRASSSTSPRGEKNDEQELLQYVHQQFPQDTKK